MSTKDITDAQVVSAVHRAELACWIGGYAHDILAAETGQSVKVCCRAMERAVRRGLLDWGVSLRTAWLTDKGTNLLSEVVHASR